jgi:hypothetical protein
MPRKKGHTTEKENPFLSPLAADQTIYRSSIGLVITVVILVLLVWHAIADRKLRRGGRGEEEM